MPSYKSVQKFFVVNSYLCAIAAVEWAVFQFSSSTEIQWLAVCLWTVIRNALMTANIEYQVRNKPFIDAEKRKSPVEKYRGEFILNMVKSSLIEAFTKIVLHRFVYSTRNTVNVAVWLWPVYFIIVSFVCEVLFDVFHYWAHRILHYYPLLYRYTHKMHHRHQYPTSIITFYQDWVDLLLSNSLPTLALFSLIPYQPDWFLAMFFTYKIHTEIGGHTGRAIDNTPSFQQFIWLPKQLGIELYTEQHDKHHTLNNCNYAKRFALWDKLFGTYRE